MCKEKLMIFLTLQISFYAGIEIIQRQKKYPNPLLENSEVTYFKEFFTPSPPVKHALT